MSKKEKSLIDALNEKMNNDIKIIGREEEFDFKCEACGACCTNRAGGGEIILSPYDIFNLAKGLNLSIEELLEKHCRFNVGSNSGIPLFTLHNKIKAPISSLKYDFKREPENICTFLKSKDGKRICSVHAFKPAVCSLYPLGRITESMKDIKYILQQDGCGNYKKKGTEKHTVNEWVPDIENSDKAFKIYNDFIKESMDIINISNFMKSKQIQGQIKDLLILLYVSYMYAGYDTNKPFFEQFEVNAKKTKEALFNIVSGNHDHDKKIISKTKNFKSKADAYMALINAVQGKDTINGKYIKSL